MAMLNWLRKVFLELFGFQTLQTQDDSTSSTHQNRSIEPAVYFKSLSVVHKTPGNDSVGKNDFIAVIYQGKPLWVLFQCPCGCSTVISLSLQNIHKPHWTVSKSTAGRPTLYPSVWQNKGCCSHFWIKDGRVYLCDNTGVEPWVAKPGNYSKPKVKERHWRA